MTKGEALKHFFSGFGIPAYPSTSVPDDTIYPWMTYEMRTASFGEQVGIAVDLWYHTDSEAIPNAKVEEIAKAIGNGGKLIPCDDGTIWIKKGSPFSISLATDGDVSVKRRNINLTLEFLTL